MAKVKINDKKIISLFSKHSNAIFAIISVTAIFFDIPQEYKLITFIFLVISLLIYYYIIWFRSNQLKEINLDIDGSIVNIKVGDIFEQEGLKVIAFNEYFDTLVDNKVIAEKSVNGIFIKEFLGITPAELDAYIQSYEFDVNDIMEHNTTRSTEKNTKYRLGTICVYKEYLLTAFSKFDQNNKAQLTMQEYLEFLINFWDKVNQVYAQKSISTTIFGSGITRIKGHKNISEEELLKIMLWTFRISEMKFKYPAKLTIVIHEDKIQVVNLFDIESASYV